MRKPLFFVLLLIGLFTCVFPAAAQDTNVITGGLNNPRGLYYDDNGVLWIAEAGTGGDNIAQTEFGPIKYGSTARILTVSPGTTGAQVVLGGLPSAAEFDDIIGVSSIYVEFGGIWIVTGLGPFADPFNQALIQLDQKSLRVGEFVDLYGFEADNNPDQDIVMSDPVDLAVSDDDTFYIVDASGNSLLTWTVSDGLQLFHAWTDLPVPTSVDVAADGSIYVGFLSPFPYAEGSARIEHWSAQGELLDTYSGLNAVTDVLLDDSGTLYAVQMASGYGDSGWIPASGSVVTVSDSGITTVADGLNFPYRLALSPDGGIAVTINSAFSAPDSGEVVALTGEMTLGAMPSTTVVAPPATTPEPPASTPEAPSETPEASS